MTAPKMKVTEKLRETWAIQRSQMVEDDGLSESHFDVRLMDHLLTLPLGTKFNGQEEQAKLRKSKTEEG